jgi:protein-disulfide isomerase
MRAHKEAIIIGIISVLFLAGMGFLIWRTPTAVSPVGPVLTAEQSAMAVRPDSRMTGTYGAKVTMVEFGDYQCPACGYDHPILKKVIDTYSSNPNFNFVFRHFPLPQHPNAPMASQAAEAAGAQGKYWEMHDQIYSHQSEWSESKDALPFFVSYATTIGIDVAKFTSEVSSGKYSSVVKASQDDANRIGVNSTPTIYINGTQVSRVTVENLNALVDEALAK